MLRLHWRPVAISVLLLGLPIRASADPMDAALSRFRTEAADGGECPASLADGSNRAFCGDDVGFHDLMAELGTTMAPAVLSPARTLGPTGFYLGFETQITNIHRDRSYWREGAQGDGSIAGPGDPNNTITWSRLSVRKGFPFGTELGFSLGHAYHTSYWTWGFSLQVAPFEGFRTGWGWFPDFAVRGSVQTMTGDGEFHLTVPSVDMIVSKPIVIANMVRITPFFAAQLMWIVADSEVVDLTPDVDAFAECFPLSGPPQPGDEGTLRCGPGGSPDDFNNNWVFNEVRTRKWRIAIGGQLEYERLVVSAAWHIDVGGARADAPQNASTQWTFALGAGIRY